MFRLPVIILLLQFTALTAQAQVPDTIEIDELKPPSNPAFILLDLQPSAISRPSSVKDFEVSLPSLIDETGFLQRNIAIELNPYNILSPKVDSYNDFISQKKPLHNFLKSGSFSFATAGSDSVLSGTLAGFGFRTTLLNGRPSTKLLHYKKLLTNRQALTAGINGFVFASRAGTKADLEKELHEYFTVLKRDNMLDTSFLNEQETYFTRLINTHVTAEQTSSESKVAVQEIKTKLINATNQGANSAALTKAAKDVEDAGKDRFGWLLDAAYSLAVQFPDNTWGNSKIPRQAAWLTGGYRSETLFGKKATTDILGVARYLWNNLPANTGTESSLDLGLKVAFEWGKLTVEGEGLMRYNGKIPANLKSVVPKSDERITGTVSYHIRQSFLLSYTLGKNFDAAFLDNQGDVISTVSLSVATGFRKLSLK